METRNTSNLQEVSRVKEEFQASVTVHLELSGHHVELTLRDSDEGRLLKRLEAVLELYPPAPTLAGAPASQKKRQEPIRSRIYDLLRQHPSGLTRHDIEQALALSPPKDLSDTLVGLVRHRRLIRVAPGTYALRPD
jgi:hypothetical protein